MRYFYEPMKTYDKNYFQLYQCDHPLFDLCTLYYSNDLGLIVVQQRCDPGNKTLTWGPVDSDLANDIYMNPGFHRFFLDNADCKINDFFPIFSVRKVMWALRMKPLKREYWEQELQGLI